MRVQLSTHKLSSVVGLASHPLVLFRIAVHIGDGCFAAVVIDWLFWIYQQLQQQLVVAFVA